MGIYCWTENPCLHTFLSLLVFLVWKLKRCRGHVSYSLFLPLCRLISCRLKDSSCAVVVSVLQFCVSQLNVLDMSGCNLQTSEEKLLSCLGNPNCRLETLKSVKLFTEALSTKSYFCHRKSSKLEKQDMNLRKSNSRCCAKCL